MTGKGVVTHYLPHHMVQSSSSATSKFRIVYEGCAKSHEKHKTLNECLHKGKNMITNLCGALMRFRMKQSWNSGRYKVSLLTIRVRPC